MTHKPIIEIAEDLGLSVEHIHIPGHEKAIKVFKGANPIFVGTEEAVREFFTKYLAERPGPFESSMVGYKE